MTLSDEDCDGMSHHMDDVDDTNENNVPDLMLGEDELYTQVLKHKAG